MDAPPPSAPGNDPQYDESRLPYPPIYLGPHTSQTTCAVCQESYMAPREERAILYKVDRLKRLGCGHVYHVSVLTEEVVRRGRQASPGPVPLSVVADSCRWTASTSGSSEGPATAQLAIGRSSSTLSVPVL